MTLLTHKSDKWIFEVEPPTLVPDVSSLQKLLIYFSKYSNFWVSKTLLNKSTLKKLYHEHVKFSQLCNATIFQKTDSKKVNAEETRPTINREFKILNASSRLKNGFLVFAVHKIPTDVILINLVGYLVVKNYSLKMVLPFSKSEVKYYFRTLWHKKRSQTKIFNFLSGSSSSLGNLNIVLV